MRLTWLILHGEQRHRCAPDAACPYLVITRPHTGHAGVFIPPRWNNHLQYRFPASASRKPPFQQHAVSYNPESDLLDWGFCMAQGSSLLTWW